MTAMSSGPVGTGEPFERGFHHSRTAARVQIAHIDVQRGKHRHTAPYGIRDVVEFEVEEHLVPAASDLAHDVRTPGVKQLHTYLDERLPFLALKLVQKVVHLLRGRKIQRDDNILAHMHLRRLPPRLFLSDCQSPARP